MKSLLLLALFVPLIAQEAPPPGGQQGQRRGPPPEPKNLKILKPGPELIPTMRTWSASLGVKCDHCHVQGNFAADDKAQKVTARKMVEMVQHLDEMVGAGKVTCYTCHRGEVEPKSAVPAPAPGNAPAARPPQ